MPPPPDPAILPTDSPRPDLTPDDAVEIARIHWDVEATATELPSHSDRAYRLDLEDGSRRVLKVLSPTVPQDWLECEHAALARAREALPGRVAEPMESRDGELVATVTDHTGRPCAARLVTWLDGRLLAESPRSKRLHRRIGRALATVDQSLAGLEHPRLQRTSEWDLAHAPRQIEERLGLVEPAADRVLLERFVRDWRERFLPRTVDLPRAVIHNDANDYNLLVRAHPEGEARRERFAPSDVAGILDFGDVVETWRVAELAVALAYLPAGADLLRDGAPLVAGYHEVAPLESEELELLLPLMRLRFAQSAAMSAASLSHEPDDPYHRVSSEQVWRGLRATERTSPAFAAAVWRTACGLGVRPGAAARVAALEEAAVRPVLAAGLDQGNTRLLDLSVASPHMAELSDPADPKQVGDYVSSVLGYDIDAPDPDYRPSADRPVGWGRYDEPRPLYAGEAFRGAGEARTIHLGVDLFAPPGAEILAPLDGTVESAADNSAPGDYGGTVILRHDGRAGAFWTLYGHLDPESIAEHRPGAAVAAGKRVGRLGATEVNGRWTPHLHFQILLDLLEGGDVEAGNFPGVAAPSRRRAWRALCPDPNRLLRLEHPALDDAIRESEPLRRERRRRISTTLSLSYAEPLQIVRGQGCELIDHLGRRYLDLVNNVCHVGHANPEVVRATARQMAVLNTNTRYLHPTIVDYAERLTATLPEPLEVCFFVNSGSEANDLALRMARVVTGRRERICVDGAYHGHTAAVLDVSPYKHDGPGGDGTPGHVHKMTLPDVFRGPHRGADAGARYAEEVAAAIEESEGGIGSIIVESMLSCGGQILLPPGYLQKVFELVRAAGGLTISDEVQVGFGRAGSHFWGFEAEGVVPDIVTMGKPMGNGHPVAAVVTTREVADAFANGMEYFNTFGGNPVSCTAARTVLEIVQRDGLQQHAAELGARFLDGLRELVERHEPAGDARGRGLFLGLEIVDDGERRNPDADLAWYLVQRMKSRGFLLSTDGPQDNVIKIKPPLVIEREQIERTLEALEEELQAVGGGGDDGAAAAPRAPAEA